MDDYVSKPVQREELFEAIERAGSTSTVSETKTVETSSAEDVLDRASLMARVDGDMELLREIVELFLEEVPKSLSDLRAAMAQGDSKALEQAAHRLKGMAGNLGGQAIFDAALKVETMGREGDFEDAEAACAELEEEIKRLKPALIALVDRSS